MHKLLKCLSVALLWSGFSLQAVQLNEIRTDQPDFPDDEEYVELRGEPGESLDGVWFLYVGDHSGDGSFKRSGTVEIALNLSGYSIPDDGHFLMVGSLFDGEAFGLSLEDVDYLFEGFGSALENSDNVTAMLVRNWTGNGGAEVLGIDDQLGDAAVDIDDDDDGVPNESLPFSEVIDAIGLVETLPENIGDLDEFNYGAAFGFTDIGPNGFNVPAHAFRASDTGEWQIGEYVLFEEDNNGTIIGINPEAFDTPGSINPVAPPETFEPVIETVSTIFTAPGETIVLTGVNLETSTLVTFNGVEAAFVVDGANLVVTIPEGANSGIIEVTNPDGTTTTASLIVVADVAGAPLAEDFADGLGDFTTYSAASTANWEFSEFRDSASIEANGFGADEASDDWLISPAVDLSSVADAYLRIGHERVFEGPALQVKISTDYTGTGDPSAATWTDLPVTVAGDNANEIVDSGAVDLSAYEGQTVYIAFRYTTTGTGPGQGAIDRIHFVIVGGVSFGWRKTDEFGFVYFESPDLGFSYDLDYIYIGGFPWVYQTNFGYMYHAAFVDGLGFWFYHPTLEWIFLEQGAGAWFRASGNDWAYDNFINPLGNGG